MIANARMYDVAPGARAAWRALFARVSAVSGVPLEVIDHAFPAPLPALYGRADLGCAFMCGWPYIRRRAEVAPVAAPVPVGSDAPVYWTDIVVRADDPAERLADLAGRRMAYTAFDSQSGFNAPRHHFRMHGLAFAPTVGPLTTPRRVMEAVARGEADAGPLDSYAHALLRRHDPALAALVRVVARTEPTACPLLVASAAADGAAIDRLRSALLAYDGELDSLCLARFAMPPPDAAYAQMQRWAEEGGAP